MIWEANAFLVFKVCGLTSVMHTLQEEQDGFTDIDKLRDELLAVLKNIHKEKEEETLKIVIWCHLGHAYIKEVSEGERKMQKFPSLSRFHPLSLNFKVMPAVAKLRHGK